MILSEKELERMIGEALGAACPEKVAAHAIAKKLAEGVVWDEEYKVSYDGNCRFWEIDCSSGVRYYAGELATDALADLDGQRVTVTVTKEE